MAIIDVIKYEGENNDILIFKHPIEDFNKNAKLIVHENQEAVVYINGVASEPYKPGAYKLESKNIPGIKHIIGLISGGELANHCEVFYINKGILSNVQWETSDMDIQDQALGTYCPFQAKGVFSAEISDYGRFLKIVGISKEYEKSELQKLFSVAISGIAREAVSIAMVNHGISYGAINSYLSQFSDIIGDCIRTDFQEIGLTLKKFVVEGIFNIDKRELEEFNKTMWEKRLQDMLGKGYIDKRTFDTLLAQANNQGVAGANGAAVAGTMLGMGVGQVYNGMVAQTVNRVFNNDINAGNNQSDANLYRVKPRDLDCLAVKKCKHCGEKLESGARFCSNCGKPTADVIPCPNCGTVNSEGAHFCSNCGANIINQ